MATSTRRQSNSRPLAAGLGVRWHRLQRRYAPYIFISPFFILFAVFGVFPTIFSVYLSFQQWNPIQGLGAMEFVGFENYTWLLGDPWFWKAMWNTLWLALISGLPQHLIAIPLAFALVMGVSRLRHLLTAAYFLPFITSTVAVAIVFQTILGTQFGILNQTVAVLAEWPPSAWIFSAVREALPVDWLGRAQYIKPSIAILVIWKYFGFNVVLYTAGLSTIPREYYQAAAVDGANLAQRFWFITLPLLRPMIFFAVTLTIIGNLQLFDEPFVLTNLAGNRTGGPDEAGLTVAMYLYRTGFEWVDMGTAAAMSWVLFVVIGAATFIHFRFLGRRSLERREG